MDAASISSGYGPGSPVGSTGSGGRNCGPYDAGLAPHQYAPSLVQYLAAWINVLAYLLLMGLALPLSILAAAAAYQFTTKG